MDRPKKPHPWSDGTREPRRLLSAQPNRDLLRPQTTAPLDCRTLEQCAANQAFDDFPDEAVPVALDTGVTES
ncbi:hypothetical protein ACVW0Y_001149 [Pseudomonas sp. TE3786]